MKLFFLGRGLDRPKHALSPHMPPRRWLLLFARFAAFSLLGFLFGVVPRAVVFMKFVEPAKYGFGHNVMIGIDGVGFQVHALENARQGAIVAEVLRKAQEGLQPGGENREPPHNPNEFFPRQALPIVLVPARDVLK